MADVLEVDPFDGEWIFSFDGRVLEIFGSINLQGVPPATRIHIKDLSVEFSDPNRKGFRILKFGSRNRGGSPVCTVRADETQWSSLEPLFEALQGARARIES